jgi:hypothetical protein
MRQQQICQEAPETTVTPETDQDQETDHYPATEAETVHHTATNQRTEAATAEPDRRAKTDTHEKEHQTMDHQ